MPDPDMSRNGKLLSLRRTIDDEITLEPAMLEQLTPAQEAEAAELLAALFAAAASRRPRARPLEEAA